MGRVVVLLTPAGAVPKIAFFFSVLSANFTCKICPKVYIRFHIIEKKGLGSFHFLRFIYFNQVFLIIFIRRGPEKFSGQQEG